MDEVNDSVFFGTIEAENLEVVTSVENVNNYPYTTLYRLTNGSLYGKIVESYTDSQPDEKLIQSKYYINNFTQRL